jgi:hypothetical protein
MATRGREAGNDNPKTTGQGNGTGDTWTEGGPAFRPGQQHPPEWRRDLNPDAMAGQNVGLPDSEHLQYRTAYDDKALHERWQELPDDVLKNLVLLPPGERLKQGATYFDMTHPEQGEFTAMGNESVEPGQRLLAKADIGYDTWNLVVGVNHPLGRDEHVVEPQGYNLRDQAA